MLCRIGGFGFRFRLGHGDQTSGGNRDGSDGWNALSQARAERECSSRKQGDCWRTTDNVSSTTELGRGGRSVQLCSCRSTQAAVLPSIPRDRAWPLLIAQ